MSTTTSHLDPWSSLDGSLPGRGPAQLRAVSSLLGPSPNAKDLEACGLEGLVGAWVVDATDPACAGAAARITRQQLAEAVAAAPGRLPENVLDLVAPASGPTSTPAPVTRRRLLLRETGANAPATALVIENGDLLLGAPGSTWTLASGGTVQLPTAAQWRALADDGADAAICLIDAKQRIASRKSFHGTAVWAGVSAALAIFGAGWVNIINDSRQGMALVASLVLGVLSVVLWARLSIRWNGVSGVDWLRALSAVVAVGDVLLVLAAQGHERHLGHLNLWGAVLLLHAGIVVAWWTKGRPALGPWLGTAAGATALAVLAYVVPQRDLASLVLPALGAVVLFLRHRHHARRRADPAPSTPSTTATAATATPAAWRRRLLIGGIVIALTYLPIFLRHQFKTDDEFLEVLLLGGTLMLLVWLPLWFKKARRELWWLVAVCVLFTVLAWA